MIKYTGQLEEIDTFNYGVQLRKENNSYCFDSHPKNIYTCDDPDDYDIFEEWYENMLEGWQEQDCVINKKLFLESLESFKKIELNVGDVKYIEYPNDSNIFCECIIEYISPEKDKILVRYTEIDSKYNLNLITYFYSKKVSSNIFPCFYDERPSHGAIPIKNVLKIYDIENKYNEDLIAFKSVIPNVGDNVYIENPTNNSVHIECSIEFIPKEKDKILIKYKNNFDQYGKSIFALLTYSYSEKHGHAVFPVIHT